MLDLWPCEKVTTHNSYQKTQVICAEKQSQMNSQTLLKIITVQTSTGCQTLLGSNDVQRYKISCNVQLHERNEEAFDWIIISIYGVLLS